MAGTNLFGCGQDRSGGGPVLQSAEGTADPNVGATVSLAGEMTTDFDLNESANLVTLLTSKHQCNNGGWKTFGTEFKNQGDCESFVATRGKNPPAGS
jgi:hypothetical protein